MFFIIGRGSKVRAMGNKTLEQQTNAEHNDFEKFVDIASRIQVLKLSFDHKIRRAVENAVEKCRHDATLTAMDNVVIPTNE